MYNVPKLYVRGAQETRDGKGIEMDLGKQKNITQGQLI